MERFINGTEECIVLMRNGETALIVRPANEGAPFVVPLQHLPDNSDWWQGKYFDNFDNAYSYFKGVLNDDLGARLQREVDYAKTSVMPQRQLYQAHGRITMARELGALTLDEYLKLDHDCVAEGINNSKYFD